MKNVKSILLGMLPDRVLFELKKLRYVRSLNSFSEKDVKVVKLLVKPGDYVLDVGANVGWYTKVLSDLVGKEGRVYSIEPVPMTFDLLSFCVKKLGLKNVELMNCAISNRDGSALMEVPTYAAGGENFYEAKIIENKRTPDFLRRFKVDLKSIDSLFLNLRENISFIKCDVEGHEFAVFEGARGFMDRLRPAWLMEVTGDPDNQESDSSELFKRFKNLGYAPYWFNGETLDMRRAGDKSSNYFFLRSEHIAILKVSGMGIYEEAERV